MRTADPHPTCLDIFPTCAYKILGIETFTVPHPAIHLATRLHHQSVGSFTGLSTMLPDDTQQDLCSGNHAAIAKPAALLSVNTMDADFAAGCIGASGLSGPKDQR